MKLASIPQRTDTSQCYRVHISFDYIEKWLASYAEQRNGNGLDLYPDFQRGHVWTAGQQSAFVEFLLQGGETTPIMWNVIGGIDNSDTEPLTIVDGLQRLTALRGFLAGKVPAFGTLIHEFEDINDPVVRRGLLMRRNIVVWVNNLRDRKAVLRWYLEINAGGTPHSTEEIERVRGLLEKA